MKVQLLEDIGFTKPQAIAYLALVEHGTQTAPALAKMVSESRTNAYKILDKLVEFGLATKQERGKRFTYTANSPTALEQFVARQAQAVQQKERQLKTELPHLLDYYFAHSERPSIRYFEGKEGMISIYKDQIASGAELRYIHTPADIRFLSFPEIHHLRNTSAKLGIRRHGIIQDVNPRILPEAERLPVTESDRLMLLSRTWIHEDDYTAPVEWAVYGSKLSIIAYGEEAMGMVIESQPIADAFRQIYKLMDEGIRRRPEYGRMPLKLKYTGLPDSLKKKK